MIVLAIAPEALHNSRGFERAIAAAQQRFTDLEAKKARIFMTETIRFEDFLEEQLQDPEFRADWERTAFARAIAIQIIRYRANHGLSQAALARRLGVSQASVGRLELGEHEPKISTLRNLSEKLGMRFSIDIHPEGQAPAAAVAVDDKRVEQRTGQRVERFVAGGVEMLVRAG